MASLEEKMINLEEWRASQTYLRLWTSPRFRKFLKIQENCQFKEKRDQFKRMAGQPDLSDFVDLAQISKISQNPGKWPV